MDILTVQFFKENMYGKFFKILVFTLGLLFGCGDAVASPLTAQPSRTNLHFHGIWRMDWGLGNPNRTAALIAVLMIAIWTFPLFKKWLFWVILPIFTGLGVCLMHTMSRGGFVAALCGLGVVLWRLPRPWPRGRVIAIALAVTIMLAGAVALKTTDRFTQSLEDRSITNRFEIWKAVPQMIVDAPGGWGLGNAGIAFSSWYQSTDRSEHYRTLVNSHFTWLVEFGWPMRLLYISAWFSVFILCFPPPGRVGFAVAFGIWTTFFIASIFSSVAEVCWLWIVPMLSLIAVIITRIRQRIWPSRRVWAYGLLASIAVLSIIYGSGSGDFRMKIYASSNGTVCVGSRKPTLWALVDTAAVGSTYPRALREYYSKTPNAPAIGLATSLTDIPNLAGCTLAVIGAHSMDEWHVLLARAGECQELILVAPDVFPENLPPAMLVNSAVLFGEFTHRFSFPAWTNTGKVRQLEGVGDFFKHWPEIVFETSK